MTRQEAETEAVRKWGPGSWAAYFPVAEAYGKPAYEVGGPKDSGIVGAGHSFQAALDNAGQGANT